MAEFEVTPNTEENVDAVRNASPDMPKPASIEPAGVKDEALVTEEGGDNLPVGADEGASEPEPFLPEGAEPEDENA